MSRYTEMVEFNAKLLKKRFSELEVAQKEVAADTGMSESVISNAMTTGRIRPAYLKLICAIYGLDEGELTAKVEPPKAVEPSVPSVDTKTLDSINKTLFEMLCVFRSMKDTLVRIEGLASNCNVSAFETKKVLARIEQELNGKEANNEHTN